MFTDVVKCGEYRLEVPTMKPKRQIARKVKVDSATQIRATISFPPHVYESLETIAREKKVSLAWVVRDAAEKYLSDKWPLFASASNDVA